MFPSAATVVSQCMLAGTSIYCWQHVDYKAFGYPQLCYGVITVNSVIGACLYGLPYGKKLEPLHRITELLQSVLVLPSITTTIWLNYDYKRKLAVAHTAASIVPLMYSLVNAEKENSGNWVDTFVTIEVLALGLSSLVQQNYFGMITAIIMAYNHHIFKRMPIGPIPTEVMYNYGMCFFSLFALIAIAEMPLTC